MRLASCVRMTRPANSLAVGVLTLASYLVAGGVLFLPAAMVVLGAVLVAAGGYALNDVFDHKIDTVIHPERVLPRGELSGRAAKACASTLLAGGLLPFLFANCPSFVDALCAIVLLFLYSWRLKHVSGVAGNLVVALLASNGAIIGGLGVGNLSGVASLAVCVFFATLAREIAKDVEDLPGDETAGRRTLPMLVGRAWASRLAAFSLGMAILATYLPFVQAVFGKTYLFAASAINVAALCTVVHLALKGSKHIGLLQRLIKVEMFLYILMFLAATLFGL
jgi:geranylgeranylglycerol-phosphate geranylgeranyltransferase